MVRRGTATQPWLVILELKGRETVPPLRGEMFVVRRRTHGHVRETEVVRQQQVTTERERRWCGVCGHSWTHTASTSS